MNDALNLNNTVTLSDFTSSEKMDHSQKPQYSPQTHALEYHLQQYRKLQLQQLQQNYHEHEQMDGEYEESNHEEHYDQIPDEERDQHQQYGQHQMPFEAERFDQNSPVVLHKPTPLYTYPVANGPHDHAQNMEAQVPLQYYHAPFPLHHDYPPQRKQIKASNGPAPNQVVRPETNSVYQLPDNQTGSTSTALNSGRQQQFQTRESPFVWESGYTSDENDTSNSGFLISSSGEAPPPNIEVNSNMVMAIQQMQEESVRREMMPLKFIAPPTPASSSSRNVAASNGESSFSGITQLPYLPGSMAQVNQNVVPPALPSAETGYSRAATASKQNLARSPRIPESEVDARRHIAEGLCLDDSYNIAGAQPPVAHQIIQNRVRNRSAIPTPQPIDFSLKAQDLTSTKRPHGDVGVNNAALDESRNQEVCGKRQRASQLYQADEFSTPAQMSRSMNQHQQFASGMARSEVSGNGGNEPPPQAATSTNNLLQQQRPMEMINPSEHETIFKPNRQQELNTNKLRVTAEAEGQQLQRYNNDAWNVNLETGVKIVVSELHQQPGPGNQTKMANMPQGSRTQVSYADLDMPDEMFNVKEQNRIEMFKPVPEPMTRFPASFRAPKCFQFKTIEGGYSDLLLNKLKDNYLTRRNLIYSEKQGLMTPHKFLSLMSEKAEVNVHTEQFRCYNKQTGQILNRFEVYAGRFCGVAISERRGLGFQLAMAHLLDRMQIHFSMQDLQSFKYAMFPGCEYTAVKQKLILLCLKHNLGRFDSNIKDNGSTSLGPRYTAICTLKGVTTEVRHDNYIYGRILAFKKMYEDLTDPSKGNLSPPLEIQLKNYYAVGSECPTRKDMFAELGLTESPPDDRKLEWMLENKVEDTDICLHDPTNSSSYLDNGRVWKNFNDANEYKEKLVKAMRGIRSANNF